MIEINSSAVADAASVANWDRPSSDILNSEFQDRLADSLVADDESVRPLSDFDIDSASDERLAEEWANGEQADFAEEGTDEAEQPEVDYEEARQEFRDELEFNQILDRAKESIQEQEQPQAEAVEFTPAEINAQIAQLDHDLHEGRLKGFIDLGAAERFTSGLTALTSTPGVPETGAALDAAAVARPTSWLGVNCIERYIQGERLENSTPMHPTAALVLGGELIKGLGGDPQQTTVQQKQEFAHFAQQAYLNTLAAIDTYGIDAPLHLLTHGEMAQLAGDRLLQIFGPAEATMPPHLALGMGNLFTELVRDHVRAYVAIAQRQQQRTQSGTRTARTRSRFRSNADLFDDEAEQIYRLRKGRL